MDGTRAILYFDLYFDAHWDAGLVRAVAAASAGLVFWLVAGAAAVKWYDRRGLSRMPPEVRAYVHEAAPGYGSR